MSNSRLEAIKDFIHQCLEDKQKGGPLRALACVHFKGGEVEEVDRIALVGGMTVPELAKRLHDRARQRIHDVPGVQSFEILAFFNSEDPDKAGVPGDKLPFALNGRMAYEGSATEGPTTQGLVQQMMRHQEVMMQTYAGGFRQLQEGYQNLVRTQDERIARLEADNTRMREENADAFIMVRDAALASRTEDFNQAMQLQRLERNRELMAQVLRWAPAIVNQLTGKKVFPEATEDTAIVEGLLSRMQPAHIQMVAGLLGNEPGGQAVIGLLSKRANEYFQKRDQNKKELAQASTEVVQESSTAEAAEGELG